MAKVQLPGTHFVRGYHIEKCPCVLWHNPVHRRDARLKRACASPRSELIERTALSGQKRTTGSARPEGGSSRIRPPRRSHAVDTGSVAISWSMKAPLHWGPKVPRGPAESRRWKYLWVGGKAAAFTASFLTREMKFRSCRRSNSDGLNQPIQPVTCSMRK